MTWPPLSSHDRDSATRRSRVGFYFVSSTKNETEAISLRDENYRADTNNKKKTWRREWMPSRHNTDVTSSAMLSLEWA